MKVSIIGSGIAGLASAVRMAARGYEVNVYESADGPGGKLREYKSNGYRFDAGPSLFTMPQYVDDLFKLAGENPRDHFNYRALEVICNYFWEDGTRLEASADWEVFKEEAEKKIGIDRSELERYYKRNKLKYELTGKIFLEKSLHKWSTWWDKDVVKALMNLHKLDIFKSMHQTNASMVKSPKMVQFFNRFATYNGSNPYQASGMLTIIPYLEQGFGAFIPEKGMYHITEEVYNLGKRLGVKYHFNKKVDKILVHNKKATAIEVGGQTVPSDIVICNMDVFFAYQHLLADQKKPKRILSQEKSSSALIFYWGINRKFPELDVHNIFFTEDYEKEFAHIQSGKVYNDPTVYINITSKVVEQDAPQDGENWFTMINVPFNSGQDWDAIIEKSRQNIKEKLSRILGTDIAQHIETELILEPRTIESKTQSHLGALYGTASNDRMAAFFRHPNFSSDIKDLYFCGGSAHPGGGIPLCLLSAKIVDDIIHTKA